MAKACMKCQGGATTMQEAAVTVQVPFPEKLAPDYRVILRQPVNLQFPNGETTFIPTGRGTNLKGNVYSQLKKEVGLWIVS